MDNAEKELNDLLRLLEPEFHQLTVLVKQMIAINSPYKHEFNYVNTIINSGRMFNKQHNIEKTVSLLASELNQFSSLLEKINQDGEFRDLYIKEGLLDKCLSLKKDMEDKISF